MNEFLSRDVPMLPASLRNGTCRHERGAVRCVDLRHGALRPLRHGCTCRRRRRSTSCGALQVTTTRSRPGPRGETGAGRDELLCGWKKMKMQLCAAQLPNGGVLMRIEPTGHLDVDYT